MVLPLRILTDRSPLYSVLLKNAVQVKDALKLIGWALPPTDSGVNVSVSIAVHDGDVLPLTVISEVLVAALIIFTALPAIFNVSTARLAILPSVTARSSIFTVVTPSSPICRVFCVPSVTTSMPTPSIRILSPSIVPVFNRPPLIVVISVLDAFPNSVFKLVNVTNPLNCVEAKGAEKVIVCDPPKLASVS